MATTAWRGTTAAERESERRARLIEAALGLLDTEGTSAVTIRAVTRTAGVSPRLFYESFADRDALLFALWSALSTEMAERVNDALAGAPVDFEDRTRAALLAFAQWLQESPRRSAFMLRDTLADPVLQVHARRLVPTIVEATLSTPGEPAPADPLLVAGIGGAVVNVALEWSEGRLDLTPGGFADGLTRFALGALGAPPRSGSPTAPALRGPRAPR